MLPHRWGPCCGRRSHATTAVDAACPAFARALRRAGLIQICHARARCCTWPSSSSVWPTLLPRLPFPPPLRLLLCRSTTIRHPAGSFVVLRSRGEIHRPRPPRGASLRAASHAHMHISSMLLRTVRAAPSDRLRRRKSPPAVAPIRGRHQLCVRLRSADVAQTTVLRWSRPAPAATPMRLG
jgi:hypothetical protein